MPGVRGIGGLEMIKFVTTNPLLILAIIGTTITFIVSVSQNVSTKRPRRLLVVLAVLGFVVLLVQQLLQFGRAHDAVLVEQARNKTINEIKSGVFETKGIVQQIEANLAGFSLAEFGTKVITVVENEDEELREVENILAFGKGPPSVWFKYKDWLTAVLGATDKAPCLSINIGADGHYNVGLLLAYLLTAPHTQDVIRPIIEDGTWDNIPANELLNQLRLNGPRLKCALFFDRDTENLIGYADVLEFSSELIAYTDLGRKVDVENVLNNPHVNASDALTDFFQSVKPYVTTKPTIKEVVHAMLEQQTSEIAVMTDKGIDLVKLEKVVQLATRSR